MAEVNQENYNIDMEIHPEQTVELNMTMQSQETPVLAMAVQPPFGIGLKASLIEGNRYRMYLGYGSN